MWQKARFLDRGEQTHIDDRWTYGREVWVEANPPAVRESYSLVADSYAGLGWLPNFLSLDQKITYRSHLTYAEQQVCIPAASLELLPEFAESIQLEPLADFRARVA